MCLQQAPLWFFFMSISFVHVLEPHFCKMVVFMAVQMQKQKLLCLLWRRWQLDNPLRQCVKHEEKSRVSASSCELASSGTSSTLSTVIVQHFSSLEMKRTCLWRCRISLYFFFWNSFAKKSNQAGFVLHLTEKPPPPLEPPLWYLCRRSWWIFLCTYQTQCQF